MTPETTVVDGPWFEELAVGDLLTAPAVTLDPAMQVQHRAILGDRLPLHLDRALARTVARRDLAHPGLVWDVAIGQSSVATRQVLANLYYRGLLLRSAPALGDTLTSTTEVRGRRTTRDRDDRPPRGLVLLRTVTRDQRGTVVLDFERCAMLPRRHRSTRCTELWDDRAPDHPPGAQAPAWLSAWALDQLAARGAELAAGPPAPAVGTVLRLAAGDVVSSAPELARMTINLAAVHHDAGDGRRLVYGGHTIGLALGQASRAVPRLMTVTQWLACDHVGPVFEGDTLRSTVTVVDEAPLRDGAVLLTLRSHVVANGDRPVLDWTFAGVAA